MVNVIDSLLIFFRRDFLCVLRLLYSNDNSLVLANLSSDVNIKNTQALLQIYKKNMDLAEFLPKNCPK